MGLLSLADKDIKSSNTWKLNLDEFKLGKEMNFKAVVVIRIKIDVSERHTSTWTLRYSLKAVLISVQLLGKLSKRNDS